MPEPKSIEFYCLIKQVKSMADHSYNVTINLPEYCSDQAGQLLKLIDTFCKGVLVFEDDSGKETIRNANY
jgi:hypothetical protein